MKKAFEDGVDSSMSLLNQRNTPRDSKLISPAQRLMSRQTKTLLPIADELLKPEIKDPKIVQEQLQMYRAQQKKNFDCRTRWFPKKKNCIRQMQTAAIIHGKIANGSIYKKS